MARPRQRTYCRAMEQPHHILQDANYSVGLDWLCRLEATNGPSIIEALADIAPDLASLAISFAYGQIYSRPQLKFHLAGALNAGATSTELVELMLHLVVYAGFPAGLNGVIAAREVFTERGITHNPTPRHAEAAAARDTRFRNGWEALRRIDGHVGEQIIASLADLAPDLGRFIVNRELATVALLAALGAAAPQLRVHIHGLLNVGGTREQLIEALIHTAAYAGFPAAINAMLVAKEVLAERGTTSPTGSAPTAACPP